ncbi:MAG: hypothetical protein GX879_04465 [Bacteroidales bacterium]|nr:hypothetical protein [Bacteroidales bacterium]
MKSTKRIDKVIIVINEAHLLLTEQQEIIKNKFNNKHYDYENLSVPMGGWNLEQMEDEVQKIKNDPHCNHVVFVSPIPYMIKRLSYISGYAHIDHCRLANGPLVGNNTFVYVFHNDKREKKELPNGKIIQAIAKTGWQLV